MRHLDKHNLLFTVSMVLGPGGAARHGYLTEQMSSSNDWIRADN